MADSKKEETFKVIDRRHFTEEGNLRPEVVELERREEEAAAKEAAAKKAANPPAKPAPNAHNPTTKVRRESQLRRTLPQAPFRSTTSAARISALPRKTTLTLLWSLPARPESYSRQNPPKGRPREQTHSSRSFQMLVDFLTRNAAAMLGGMADPQTGRPFVDLEGAREVIDMLDALREKTRGNLSKEDDQLLLEVLGSLKLTFMEISKAAAEAMAKKAKAK